MPPGAKKKAAEGQLPHAAAVQQPGSPVESPALLEPARRGDAVCPSGFWEG